MAERLGVAGRHAGIAGLVALRRMLTSERDRVEKGGAGVSAEDRSTLLPATIDALAELRHCDEGRLDDDCRAAIIAATEALEYYQRLVE